MAPDIVVQLFTNPSTILSTILTLVVVAYVAVTLVSLLQHRKIRRLGATALIIPHWAPLGVDLAYKCSQALASDQFLEFAQELLHQYARTVELWMVGERIILTDDPENIKAILKDQFSCYSKGEGFHSIWHNVLGDSVFSTSGKEWLANRNVLRPHLSRVRASDTSVLEARFPILVDHLMNINEPVNVDDILDRWVLDVVTEIFYGKSMDTLSSAEQPFRRAMNRVLGWNTWKTMFGSAGSYLPDYTIRPDLKVIEEQLSHHVSSALHMDRPALKAKPEIERTLMESLALKETNGKAIRDHLITILLAGKDPIAVSLSWALYELAQHPDVLQRLREEIGAVVGFEKPPTQVQLKGMPYLSNIVKEILRLYPPIAMNMRSATADTTLPVGGGPHGTLPIGIPRGTQILYSAHSLHRRVGKRDHTSVTDDGNEFNPSRWESWEHDSWEYIPFNNGPLTCLGRAFGQLSIEWVLTRLFQIFDRVEPGDHRTRTGGNTQRIELNSKPAQPIMCKFHKAESR